MVTNDASIPEETATGSSGGRFTTGTLEPATTPECVSRIWIAVATPQGAGSDERLDVEL